MAEQNVGNRGIILIGGIMLQLCLGAVYAWSVFAAVLKGNFGWGVTETQIIFSVALATFALVMVFAGKLVDKMGPQKVALVGVAVLGVGYILSSFNPGSFIWMILTLGILAGAGIGIAYSCPIVALGKWFPDKLGLATGLAVFGFGAGAFFIAAITKGAIKMPGINVQWTGLMASQELSGTLLIWGIVFLVVGGLGAFLLRNPPAGWIPAGWSPPKASAKAPTTEDWERGDMIKTPQFWMLLAMFVFAASAGLMTIGILAMYGTDSLLGSFGGDKAAAGAAAATAVGIFAVLNGAGRIFWGWASDKIGRPMAMAIMFFAQGGMMMLLGMKMLGSTEATLILAACWIGLMFGGNFALFPTATRDFFGIKNYGANYAMVFLGYGVAGIVGPQIAGYIKSGGSGYEMAFIICGVMCVIAAILAFITKAPHHTAG